MLLVDKSIKVSFETFVKDIKLYDIDKMKQQGYYIDIRNNIEKINEYNIIFCMDD